MADTAPTAAPDIACPACHFLNPSTRIYCQDCGAKLKGLPPPSIAAPTAGPTHLVGAPAASGQLRHARTPWFDCGATFWSLLRITLLAALAAVIIQILRPPFVPASNPPMTEIVAAQTRDRLTDIAAGNSGGAMTFPWVLINSYLGHRVPPAPTSGAFGLEVEFLRVIATPVGPEFRLLAERRISGYPFYVSLQFQPISNNGGTALRVTNGALGRLPLPGFIAQFFTGIFQPVQDRLFYEVDILRKARKVEIRNEAVSVQFRP